MPLFTYTSNRMENLVTALSDVVRVPLSSPFVPETIVVQSKGMQRWVAMELARRLGVWGNCDYPFPDKIMGELFAAFSPDGPRAAFFSVETMTWAMMAILPGMLDREDFLPLRHYLAGDRDGLKLLQISGRVADTFDRYSMYRPQMLLQWERDRQGGWQGALWRAVAAHGEFRHRARLKEQFLLDVRRGNAPASPVPQRISVFGVSYLPPFHLEVLAAAARLTEVHLFLLSPSREYWGDMTPPGSTTATVAGNTGGNVLLASFGRLGRHFSELLIDVEEGAAAQKELYEEPPSWNLLNLLQCSILNAADMAEAGNSPLPDRSIQVHSCHNPMREIEVLHDNLLSLLETVEGLEPRDIVVMTPDIDTYAPYISALFGGTHQAERRIPYSIADRNLAAEGKVSSVVLKIFALARSRFPVPQVLDVLESYPVARKFGLHEQELELIHLWLEKTRVRWGMDERDRQRRGLPPFRNNTWFSGLERLLLGYALPEREGELFNGRLPYDEIEGSSAGTLGKLASFVTALQHLSERLSSPHTMGEWRDLLRSIVENFVAGDDAEAGETATVLAIIDTLTDLEAGSGYRGAVEPAVIGSWLSDRLTKEERGYGFITGGVTFCAMLPLRSIPFRVVALVGMNDGAFPRHNPSPAFDLIAQHPRPGDRTPRDEDRYLFLESILSARDCLYISYVGQSMKDNSDLPPSVVVSELLDLVSGLRGGDGQPIGSSLVTRHRLQPFSSVYFTPGSSYFSYSTENCAALLDKHDSPWAPEPFMVAPLAPPPDEWKELALPTLLRFFRNPSRYFLENRLGLRLLDEASGMEEREPFSVEGLDGYSLKQELLDMALQDLPLHGHYPVVCNHGLLPPGRHGELLYTRVAREVSCFSDVLKAKITEERELAPLSFNLCINGFRISGKLDRLWPSGMLRYRCAKMKAKDLIGAWIEHLALNACAEDGYPRHTTIIMMDGCKTFLPVENAAAMLADVLELYWQGLLLPLRFFPESSWAYAKDGAWSIDRARAKWNEMYDREGEGGERHFRLCFGCIDPFTADFESAARTFFDPMLRHLAGGKGVSS